VGSQKTLTGGHIHKITIEFIAGGKSKAMYDAVQSVPAFAEFGKQI
jgi:hypothetical protein